MAADHGRLPAVACFAALAAIAHRFRRHGGWCAALLLLAQLISGAALARDNRAGDFDYYVLSLSWSPSYCATGAGAHDNQQCAPGRRFAFVLHGLWPQYDKGWPQDCATSETWVPEEEIQAMLAIMPSRQLMIHEWKRHGSCSGLSLHDYFATSRSLFAKVKIPARYLAPTADVEVSPSQLVADFVKTNRDLTPSMIAVECGNRSDRGRLAELRLCVNRDGGFTDCGANEARQCRAQTLIMPRVR